MAELKYHDEHRHATWLELFFDLVFVASIGVIAHRLSHTHDRHLDTHQLWSFVRELLPVWWIWASHTLYSNRFDTDGRTHRVSSLAIMFLMVTMTAFVGDGISDGFSRFVAFYIVIRCVLAGMYLSAGDRLGGMKTHTRAMAIATSGGAAVAVVALFFGSPLREAVFLASVALETMIVYVLATRPAVVSVHRSHLVERVGLFSIILLGESVISMVAGLRGIEWNTYSVTAALTGFLMLVAIWWIYFDSFDMLERARRLRYGFVLLYPHALYIIGLGILASVIGHAVRNDLVMEDFAMLTISGVTLLYLGKQITYFVVFPPYRFNIVVNTTVCVAVTIASTVLLPRIEYSLVGVTVGLIFYSLSNFRWTLPKDLTPYLKAEEGR